MIGGPIETKPDGTFVGKAQFGTYLSLAKDD